MTYNQKEKLKEKLQKCKKIKSLKYGSWNSPNETYISLKNVLEFIDKYLSEN